MRKVLLGLALICLFYITGAEVIHETRLGDLGFQGMEIVDGNTLCANVPFTNDLNQNSYH